MITIDEPRMPDRVLHELRDDVGRRSARFRRRQRVRLGILCAGATATAAALFLVAVTGPVTEVRTSQNAGVADSGSEMATVESGGRNETPPVASDGVPRLSGKKPSAAVQPNVTVLPPKPPSEPSAQPLPAAQAKAKVLFRRDGIVYEVHADGTGLREVHRTEGRGYAFSWSPDGKRLLYTDDEDLVVVDLLTKERTVLFDGVTGDSAGEAAWMPDGHSVVFWRTVGLGSAPNGAFELTLLDERSGEMTLLYRSPNTPSGPDVSPDGRIAFGCLESKHVGRLCIIDRRGGTPSYVPNSSFYSQFSWSPDGQWIAATDSVGGTRSTGTIVFRPDGSGRRTLIGDRTTAKPGWFPDSSRVVFSLYPHDPIDPPEDEGCTSSPCPTDTGVWSIRLDGSDPRPITNGPKDLLLDARAS